MSFIANVLKYCIWVLLLGLLGWFAYKETVKLIQAIKQRKLQKKLQAEEKKLSDSDKDAT